MRSNSDDVERKVYGVIKGIPLLGSAYSYTRGLVYTAKGNTTEAKYSFGEATNLDNLNPLKTPYNTVKGIRNTLSDYDKGIWIGKRGLGGGIAPKLSISPGIDISHWAILINGRVYQLGLESKSKLFCASTDSESEIYSFDWTLTNKSSSKTSKELIEKGNRLCSSNSYGLLGPFQKGINCQTFVAEMLAFAVGISREDAELYIIGLIGTAFF